MSVVRLLGPSLEIVANKSQAGLSGLHSETGTLRLALQYVLPGVEWTGNSNFCHFVGAIPSLVLDQNVESLLGGT